MNDGEKAGKKYLTKKKDGTFVHPKFAKAILKYGWENFDHVILEESILEENISEREIFYSEKYDSLNNGYNNSVGEFKGRIFSNELKEKYSKRSKGANNNRAQKVIMIDQKSGKFLKLFNCAKDAATLLSLKDGRHIIDCCLNKRAVSAGYCWKYYENEEFEEVENFLDYRLESKNCSKIYRKNRTSAILLYDLDNNFIGRYEDIYEASEKNNAPISSIRNVLLGKRKQNNGLIWKYENYIPKQYKKEEK